MPGVPAGFDDDLATRITVTSNRLRGMLTQTYPALERALGPRVLHPAVADLLTRYPTPRKLETAGRGHVRTRLDKYVPRLAAPLTKEIFDALPWASRASSWSVPRPRPPASRSWPGSRWARSIRPGSYAPGAAGPGPSHARHGPRCRSGTAPGGAGGPTSRDRTPHARRRTP